MPYQDAVWCGQRAGSGVSHIACKNLFANLVNKLGARRAKGSAKPEQTSGADPSAGASC